MRLLECRGRDIRLTGELFGQIPSYAILSHTWGADGEEVTYQDMKDRTEKKKPGYNKIKFCAGKARADGLHFFWVDTCCIDKANSTELIEAINSMFRWYQKADRCYVYLSDVSASSREAGNPYESQFRASRWFTRGWTLQELLAPSSVEFFTREGLRLGDRKTLKRKIHNLTRIPVAALQNKPLAHFTTEERFRWAANRNTTKEEDSAYCLLGIFGVFIPLIPGEGKENAFRRLKKEIAEAMNSEDTFKPAQEIPQNQPRKKSGGPHLSQAVGSQSPRELPVKYEEVTMWSCSYCGYSDISTSIHCRNCYVPRDKHCKEERISIVKET